ncbi:MAG: ATP synthase F1 subunit epsilon [Elusimicrobiaceae bacterium]|jgi:F-type H+-transporting ATPase subunit epsilon|nr:ATP synthase F1 subunit epsilon [Elusimicrobiaceae bacterium]MBT3955595.1 ATP synthase F1 subunit epsilon [Elusimicrobiaceae bacterium]MBT4008642.1 ATP synthase F1 subunit epsilon [Elusimicrobiaceae bacterium]MBT4402750.1 ATP synthase F1 subunit epsilon [Elusimicrobiaceae bacterium]MBT4439615.1 ATP synthase F1 subunit epsilon [Elusimicrobiaceae bacterium]
MAKKLKLAIVTPQKQIVQRDDIDFVSIPAHNGGMGILPGHLQCVVKLEPGILTYKADKKDEEFAVMGGFAEVLDNVVSVFAESAELASEIDEEASKQEVAKQKKLLLEKHPSLDVDAAQLAIKKEIVKMQLKRRRSGR